MRMATARSHIKIFRPLLEEKFTQQRNSISDKTPGTSLVLLLLPKAEWFLHPRVLPEKIDRGIANMLSAGKKLWVLTISVSYISKCIRTNAIAYLREYSGKLTVNGTLLFNI
jgi:hypothetical protein